MYKRRIIDIIAYSQTLFRQMSHIFACKIQRFVPWLLRNEFFICSVWSYWTIFFLLSGTRWAGIPSWGCDHCNGSLWPALVDGWAGEQTRTVPRNIRLTISQLKRRERMLRMTVNGKEENSLSCWSSDAISPILDSNSRLFVKPFWGNDFTFRQDFRTNTDFQ